MHVVLGAAKAFVGPPSTIEAGLRRLGVEATSVGNECVPAGVPYRVVAVDPAPEAPPDPGWDVQYLMTLQVLS